MTNWKTNQAKNHFDEIIKACRQSPQLLYENDQPVAAIINIDLFRQLSKQTHPTIAEMLAELALIQQENPIEIEDIERCDRPNPLIDDE